VRTLNCLLVLVAVAAFGSPLDAKTKFKIPVGPTVISAEEQAIVADPDAGIEHAVILVDETVWDGEEVKRTRVVRHRRVKILSNEGRELADVEIDLPIKGTRLTEWWGRTLHPDGSVTELEKSELDRQEIVDSRDEDYDVIKAALPGVEPGCVIDYGYVIDYPQFLPPPSIINIQGRWPVREFSYRWNPTEYVPATYLLTQAGGLEIQARRARMSVIVTGKNIPPIVEESYMPPRSEVAATLHLYYLWDNETGIRSYWELNAKRVEKVARRFCKSKATLDAAIAEMELPANATVEQRVRFAYDWLTENIENQGLLTFELAEIAADEEGDEESRRTAKDLLAERSAFHWEFDLFFVGLARQLGAEAYLLLAVDRTEHLWNPEVLSPDQFDSMLVMIKVPRGTDEATTFVVDPGSGLPFGVVPWWLQGAHGFVAKGESASRVLVPTSPPDANRSITTAGLQFDEDNIAVNVNWSRDYTGQRALGLKRRLRFMSPEEREEELFDLCGESADFEVDRAEARGIEEPWTNLVLDCGGLTYTTLDEDTELYSMHFDGPWVKSPPELTLADRVHPVIINYREQDKAVFDLDAPIGFIPEQAPEKVSLRNLFGQYDLVVSREDGGYHVERRLVLTAMVITVEQYPEFLDFLKEVRRLDDTALVFRRDDSEQ